ncbi:MAG: hypothetical protein C0471_11995 [Erythrobacter sp.]|nr:hypothetical protein [Erythrobacter sp.]
MGTGEFLAILLALGSGDEPVADDVLMATAMAEKLAAEEAASIAHFLTSRTQTIRLKNCKGGRPAGCIVDAFILSPGGASGGLTRDCHYDALVSEAILMPDGTTGFAHLAILVIQPRRAVARAKFIQERIREPEAFAVSAAMIFDAAGFHPVCFERTVLDSDFAYQFYRVPAREEDIVPDEIYEVDESEAQLSRAGKTSRGRVPPRRWRLSFFDKPLRSISETVGCTITGCPEKLAISLTVRGQGERLPILQGSTPTPYWTDKTIMVPRDQVGSLFVSYPDGTQQQVKTCRKLQETRVSLSFQCQRAK